MNSKALKTLEFDKIIHILAGHAASEGAKELCLALRPMDQIAQIELAQQETADALRRILRKGSLSFGGIRDVRSLAKRLDYCAELILLKDGLLDTEKLDSRLSPLGNSIVIAHTEELIKFHVHTDTPADIFRIGSEFGFPIHAKVDCTGL